MTKIKTNGNSIVSNTDRMMGGKSSKRTKKSSSKKSKKSMKAPPAGYIWCLQCGKNTKIISSVMRKTKNNRNQQVSSCDCGHKNYRFVKS